MYRKWAFVMTVPNVEVWKWLFVTKVIVFFVKICRARTKHSIFVLRRLLVTTAGTAPFDRWANDLFRADGTLLT